MSRQRTSKETIQSRPAKAATVAESDIQKIFDYWIVVMGRKRAVLSPERKILIGSAVHDYGLDSCMEAVRGCSVSPFHMGGNRQRKRYDSLDLIFRNSDTIERFIQIAEENPYVEPF